MTGCSCRRARGSWPTRTRRASSSSRNRRHRRCCGRWRWLAPGTEVYSRPMFKLLSTSGEQSIDLQQGRTLVVGRAVTSDIPIYDPTISRRHAEVALTENGVSIKDLGSSNGTFLNGARINEAEAAQNDVVTFGKVAFRVVSVTPPVARPQVVAPSDVGPGRPPPGGTIVRQLPVSASGGVPAIVDAHPQGASHLKVQAQTQEERTTKKLSLLLEISKELNKQQELDRLLDKVVDFTFQIMNVDRVSILLLDPKSNELVPRGTGALELPALLRAQPRRADRPAGRRRAARRAEAAGRDLLLRHPRLHADVGGHEPRRHRDPAHRVLHRNGGDRVREQRHAR